MTVPEPKINGCICDICADRGRECQRTAADEWTDQCLPCIRGEHSFPATRHRQQPAPGSAVRTD